MQPAADSDGDFTLTIEATSTEANGSTVTMSETMDVSIEAVADAPEVEVETAKGAEDGVIPISISLPDGDADGSETTTVTVAGLPDGASLSSGVDNGDGTWTLERADLDGLTLTPPADFSGDFELDITATTTESGNGDTAETHASLQVTVDAVADTPDLVVNDVQEGTAGEWMPLQIDASLTDTSGSENLTIRVEGLPEGWSLNAGEQQADGTWTLRAEDLDDLAIRGDGGGSADILITAVSFTEQGDEAFRSVEVPVTIADSDDASDLAEAPSAGVAGPREIDWGDDVDLSVLDPTSDLEGVLEQVDSTIQDLTELSQEATAADDASVDGFDLASSIETGQRQDAEEAEARRAAFDVDPSSFTMAQEIGGSGALESDPTAGSAMSTATETEAEHAATEATMFGRLFGILRGMAGFQRTQEEQDADQRGRRR